MGLPWMSPSNSPGHSQPIEKFSCDLKSTGVRVLLLKVEQDNRGHFSLENLKSWTTVNSGCWASSSLALFIEQEVLLCTLPDEHCHRSEWLSSWNPGHTLVQENRDVRL